MAGVVNVVLKDRVDGVHLDAYGAGAPTGGAGNADVSLLGGRAFPGLHLVGDGDAGGGQSAGRAAAYADRRADEHEYADVRCGPRLVCGRVSYAF